MLLWSQLDPEKSKEHWVSNSLNNNGKYFVFGSDVFFFLFFWLHLNSFCFMMKRGLCFDLFARVLSFDWIWVLNLSHWWILSLAIVIFSIFENALLCCFESWQRFDFNPETCLLEFGVLVLSCRILYLATSGYRDVRRVCALMLFLVTL